MCFWKRVLEEMLGDSFIRARTHISLLVELELVESQMVDEMVKLPGFRW